MKARNFFVSSSLFLLMAFTFSASLAPNFVEAKSGSSEKLLLADSFNSSEFSSSFDESKWVSPEGLGGIHQSSGSNVYFNLPAGDSGCEHLYFGTTSKISNISFFQFDFMIAKDSVRWIYPAFINEKIGNSNAGSFAYSGPFLINNDGVHGLEGTLSKPSQWSDLLGVAKLAGEWVTCRIVPTSSSNANIQFAFKGEPFDDSKTIVSTFKKTSRSFSEAYLGFQSEEPNGGFSVDNIKIVGEGTNIDETFTNYNLKDKNNVLGFYQSSGTNNHAKLYDNNYLEFSNSVPKERLISKKAKIEEDLSIIESIDVAKISFQIKIPSTSELSEQIAFVWGLGDPSSDPETNSLRYVMNKEGGKVVNYESGASNIIGQNVFKDVSSDNGSLIELSINKDGSLKLFENGNPVVDGDGKVQQFKGLKRYSGHFGFMTPNSLTTKCTIDNFIAYGTTYYVPITKSVTHNFSSDFWGNPGHEDFYCENGSGKISVNNGKMEWSGASDDTFFGSAYTYDQFILDYKLSSIYVGTSSLGPREKTDFDKWIGLDLSRSSKKTPEWGDYAMAFFLITPKEGVETVSLNLFRQAISPLQDNQYRITKIKDIPSSLFRDIQYNGVTIPESSIKQGDQVSVRWVSSGNSLHLYLKKASEQDFTHYYTIDGLQLNGYFAMCCTGYTYVKFDDFSMANTSSIYVCADNEEPKTVTETETEVIRDISDVDVNWTEEKNLNASDNSLGWQVTSIVSASLVLVLGAVLTYTIIRTKKKGH